MVQYEIYSITGNICAEIYKITQVIFVLNLIIRKQAGNSRKQSTLQTTGLNAKTKPKSPPQTVQCHKTQNKRKIPKYEKGRYSSNLRDRTPKAMINFWIQKKKRDYELFLMEKIEMYSVFWIVLH